MKKILVVIILLVFVFQEAHSQQIPSDEPSLSFYALIVSDIDQSIEWYSKSMGFQVDNRIDSPEQGFSQANLKRGVLSMELIQIEGSSTPPGRVNGIFKIGFKVKDFDGWHTFLKDIETNFRGEVVTNTSTGKRMVIVLDPDGNRIQLFEK